MNEKGIKKYEGEWKNDRMEIEKGVVFSLSLNTMTLINNQGDIIYIGGIENGMANGFGKIKKNETEWIEGEWKDGVLEIDENKCFIIEDGCVYLNEIHRNGCFGCFNRSIRSEVNIDIIQTNNNISSSDVNTIEDQNVRIELERIYIGIILISMNISTGNELMSLLNDEKKKESVSELVIEEGCGNELKTDLKICGFENLKKLIVEKNSLKNLKSLVISNNSKLESIVREYGDGGWSGNDSTNTGAFYYVKSVEITSIF